jgi:hypothetical protein
LFGLGLRRREAPDVAEIDITDIDNSTRRLVLRIKGKDVEAKVRDVSSR